jgi:predicted ATP-grasp superfamily ATP-dependent carboligase
MKVLVTSGDERSALAVVRSLGRDAEVHVVAQSERSLAGASRYTHSRHAAPDSLIDSEGFVAAILALAVQIGADVIIPPTDADCRALIPIRERLDPALLAAPSLDAYQRASHKGEVIRLAESVGLAVAEGEEVDGVEEAVAVGRSLGWPVVIRPVESVSVDPSGHLHKRGVVHAAGEDELRATWDASVGVGTALVERLLPGWGEGIFVLRGTARGKARTQAAFAHRRLREKPPAGGVSVLRESIPLDAERLQRVEALLEALDFEGPVMAEFRTDGKDCWLIELNARLWGSLQLAVDAGVDFPRLLLASTLGETTSAPMGYRSGTRLRWLLGDLDHAIALIRGSRDTRGRSGLGAALAVLLRSAGPGCHWEVLRGGDLKPFAHELRLWIAAIASRS